MPTLLTFDTTHHALWAEEVAGSRGIPVDLVPAPAAAHARCNLAIETLPERLDELTMALREMGVPFGTFGQDDDSERTRRGREDSDD